MTPPKTPECNSDAMASFAAPTGSATDELATLKAENERLKDIVRKCNRDWYRLKDFIIGCNGPDEMIRFQKAARKNNGKGVEMFLSYLDSLWRELDKAKSPNDSSSATRRTGRRDCNRDGLAGFAAAHG